MPRNLSNHHINVWFLNQHLLDYTPEQFVIRVAFDFMDALKKLNMTLSCTESDFLKAMCEAICTYYVADARNEYISLPNRVWLKPARWTSDCEAHWMQTITYFYFDSSFWVNFWYKYKNLHPFFESFAEQITIMLPYYVKRSFDILCKHKVIIMDAHDEPVLWEKYEEEEEDDDY
jgi:hypothetical protein